MLICSIRVICVLCIWACRLEDSPSGYPLQVLARITALRAFRFYPSRGMRFMKFAMVLSDKYS